MPLSKSNPEFQGVQKLVQINIMPQIMGKGRKGGLCKKQHKQNGAGREAWERKAEDMCSNRFRPASHKYSIRNRVFIVTKCSWKNILKLIMFAQIAKQIIHKQLRQMRPYILQESNLTLFTGASRSSGGRRMATSWGHNKEGNSPSRKRQRLS